MNINEIVMESIGKIDIQEIIRNQVKETVQETVKSNIRDLFKNYSDFSRDLEKAMKEELKVDFSKLNLKEYNHMIVEIVKGELDKNLEKEAAEHITETIKKALKMDGKTEYKLSEVIEELKQEIIENGEVEDWGSDINLDIEESSYGSRWIIIRKENKSRYDHEYKFAVTDEGRMFGLTLKELNVSEVKNKFFLTDLSGVAKMLFKIQLHKLKFDVDGNNCITEIEEDHDY